MPKDRSCHNPIEILITYCLRFYPFVLQLLRCPVIEVLESSELWDMYLYHPRDILPYVATWAHTPQVMDKNHGRAVNPPVSPGLEARDSAAGWGSFCIS